MAFDIANLSPLGATSKRGKAPSHFTYATLDTHATLDASGYFNSAVAYDGAYNILNLGDIIHVVVWATAIGTGTVSTYGTHIVNGKASGTLDVTNVTANSVIDSD
jgi:hypothetical protein